MKNQFEEYKLPDELHALREEVNTLRAQYHAIGDKLAPLAERERDMHDEFFASVFDSTHDKLSVIMNPRTYDVGSTFYKKGNDFMWNTYGAQFDGYNTFTKQRVPQLRFVRNSQENHAKMRKMIMDIIPYMIPLSADMRDVYDRKLPSEAIGFCMFDILEAGLSFTAAISVYISPDLKIRVARNSYGHVTWSGVMDFDEGIDFLIKTYYYSDSLDDSDE